VSLFRRNASPKFAGVSLGLAGDEAALVWWDDADATWRQAVFPGGVQAMHHRLEALLDAEPGFGRRWRAGPMQVTVGDDLLRWWMVSPPAGISSLAELEGFARLRYEELHGSSLKGWVLRARWFVSGASVCCALPASLVEGVRALKWRGAARPQLIPASRRLLSHWRAPARAAEQVVVCMSDEHRALLWWLAGGRPVRVRSLPVPASDPGGLLAAEIIRVRTGESSNQDVPLPVTVLQAGPSTWRLDAPGLQVAHQDHPSLNNLSGSGATLAAWLGVKGGADALVAGW